MYYTLKNNINDGILCLAALVPIVFHISDFNVENGQCKKNKPGNGDFCFFHFHSFNSYEIRNFIQCHHHHHSTFQ
ncbi:hypothetical protein DERP_007051 [Dermatophagoides pteronyssinus]|uniref:Uncharacterized protein n=1 Tax=Dermatophagoides pteronyssinus TaxID=6956 RepID=A0ABQ8JU10_DERPT|nr:hypothetical protein DERP_007051 [Dermatophagoides pteronyssinus]